MTGAPPSGPRLLPIAGVLALLVLYYVMAVTAAAGKSLTFDEMAHLTGGVSYWRLNDYRLHPENGNWPQRLGALPAVLGGASFPRLDQPAWPASDVYAIGDQFLYASGNDPDTMLQRGRAVMALVGVALGAIVYGWSRRLVSPLGAWISLVLFVFSPTFLAHGALVTSDMSSAVFFTAATGAMWVALHRVTLLTVLGGAVLLAGAFLSKLSAPILVPVALVMFVVRVAAGRPLAVGFRGRIVEYTGRRHQTAILMGVAVVFTLVVFAAIWASFGFRYTAFGAATTAKDTFLGQTPPQPGLGGRLLAFARQTHALPEAYIYGSSLTVQFAAERAAFLNGQFSTTGWWWYFPYAFAVKTTIPGMLVGAFALAAFIARRDVDVYPATPLLSLVAIYWAFALTTHLNIGHRHLLPIYPALCILAGGAAYWIELLLSRARAADSAAGRARRKPQRSKAGATVAAPAWRKTAGAAVVVLVAWHVVESARIRPDYLAYFNQLAGGPPAGYEHLADSSLDWGQDLPALKEWLDGQGLQRPGAASSVYLSYFGTARPERYGIQATRLAGFIDRRPPDPPAPIGAGVYCVSATVLDVIGRLFYTPQRESDYQAAFKNLVTFARASEDERTWSALLQKTGESYWHDLFRQYDQLRTGRLVAFLRHRQPDAMVGYSILIYRLSDADVDHALNGPVPDER
jgi:hypothetical protein